ncbi:Uncharacterised protein [Mycobacterium tuberculosis]|nr:Uncharacterised protein [Mycobacterium tuberculosis]CNV48639.1 Uncharacterised protein [Mycobacterium tuberculosis]
MSPTLELTRVFRPPIVTPTRSALSTSPTPTAANTFRGSLAVSNRMRLVPGWAARVSRNARRSASLSVSVCQTPSLLNQPFCSRVSSRCSTERFSSLRTAMGMPSRLRRVLGNHCLTRSCWPGVSECHHRLTSSGSLSGGGICGIVGGAWLSWALTCSRDKSPAAHRIAAARSSSAVSASASRRLMPSGLRC